MAGFHTKTFAKHDDYMTPTSAWDAISHLLPRDKCIWEPFYGDGTSGLYLQSLGFNVVHRDEDFFTSEHGEVIVSNPPFSQTKAVLQRLKELGKPFVLILPCSKLMTSYMRELFKNEGLQLIIPRRRIHFLKLVNGIVPDGWKNACNFDCLYYCWKMKFPRDLIWLE